MATESADSSATLALAAAGTSPARARRFVADRLREWQLPQYEYDATLLVSELVTNALLHARTEMVLAVRRSPDAVVVEVTDRSPQLPTARRFSLHAGTGRGLNLVAGLAREWGVRTENGGKTVWAALPIGLGGRGAGFGDFDFDSVEAL